MTGFGPQVSGFKIPVVTEARGPRPVSVEV